MVGQPLQRRVAVDDVRGVGRRPGRQIRLFPADLLPAFPVSRLCQHFHGRIDPDDLRLRPALGEQAGDVTRTAAEVIDQPRRFQRNLHQQIEGRAAAQVGELQVLCRVPCGHGGYLAFRKARSRAGAGGRRYLPCQSRQGRRRHRGRASVRGRSPARDRRCPACRTRRRG